MNRKEAFEKQQAEFSKQRQEAHVKRTIAKKMPAKKERGINSARLGRKPKGWYTDSRSDFEKQLEKSKEYL